MITILFYDFEVFYDDWMVLIIDSSTKKEHVFINDEEGLIDFYNKHKNDIWVGYNSRHYDQYILKAIICGFSPQEMNEWIIVKRKLGWEFFQDFWKIQLYNFDIMTNRFRSLKQLEGFMGHDIRETSVSFDTMRKLTDEEIEDMILSSDSEIEISTGKFNWSSQDEGYKTVEEASNFLAAYSVIVAWDPTEDNLRKARELRSRGMELIQNLKMGRFTSGNSGVVIGSTSYQSYPLNPDADPFMSVY